MMNKAERIRESRDAIRYGIHDFPTGLGEALQNLIDAEVDKALSSRRRKKEAADDKT